MGEEVRVCPASPSSFPFVHSRQKRALLVQVFSTGSKMDMLMGSERAEKEAVARWTRIGELGTEVGLRESGCSEEIIAETLRYLGSAETLDSWELEFKALLSSLSSAEDAPAVVFATVGRGISFGVKRLACGYFFHGEGNRFPRNGNEFTALYVNLRSNAHIEELNLSGNLVFGTPQASTLMATALRSNSSIQTLNLRNCGIEAEGARCLMEGLKSNRTLAELDISYNPLSDGGIEAVAEFLTTNIFLKSLNLEATMRDSESCTSYAIHLASALEKNTTLEHLTLRGHSFSSYDMKKLLQPLYREVGEKASSSDGPKNTTLRSLDLSRINEGRVYEPFFVEPIAWMIGTNKSLSTLGIGNIDLSPADWKGQIFAALKENESLEEFDLSNCTGMSEDVFEDLMNLLQFSATGLRRINLKGSEIESRQGQVDEEIRVNIQYRGQLRGQTQVPTTSGRLVMCGYEFAGKTAICKTMERIERGTPWSYQLSMGWKKVMKTAPCLRRFLFGRNAHRELKTRTRGLDVLVLRKQKYLASVWDFAGQREYYALHDYLFPNIINSCFLFVCSCRCPPDTQNPKGKMKDQGSMRDECEYWMRFIASNSKPHQGGDGCGKQLPQVRFVLTHKDTLDFDSLNISKQYAEDVVDELRNKFQDVLGICQTVAVVNAHSLEDVEHLTTLINATLKEILMHQTEYAVCKAVRNAMENWSSRNPSKPVLSLTEFRDICRNQVGPLAPIAFKDAHLYSNEGREAVLAYLNDVGDLISPKGLDFIVANPRWFGVGVLGSLIDAFGVAEDHDQLWISKCSGVLVRPKRFWKLHHKEGFVERRNIDSLLQHSLQTMNLHQAIPSDTLIQLMIHLELCFEKEPGHVDSSLFIPALFDDEIQSATKGRRQLQWKLERSEEGLHYLGRRLECENKSITFLTPGFFPRLQVHLRNYIYEKNWIQNTGFEVGRNLICFAENGVEVCVEYSGVIDYFVDILVRSSKPSAVALQFVEEHVVKKIIQFCASPQGCQGVLLVEAVIRPVCVQNLYLCADRKTHSVLASILKARVAEDDAYEHTWSHRLEGVKDTDFAHDLLEGEGSHMRVVAARQLNLFPEVAGSRVSASSSCNDEWLLSVERHLPKLFYPSIEDVGLLRKLDQWLNVAKILPIKLHLMCDHKDGSHKVQGQPGRTMRLKWKADCYDLPLAKLSLTLLWAGVSTGTSNFGVPVRSLQVDKWIDTLFNVPGMPDINAETLHQLMNRGESCKPISEQAILKALERYMKIDPFTEGLKKILNLQDGDKFWEDFRLRKVVYTNMSQQNKVGWLCERHYKSGLQERILRSVPLT